MDIKNEVSNLLVETNLSEFEDKLRNIGVYEPDDILDLSNSDLDEVGMTRVQHRRLCRHFSARSRKFSFGSCSWVTNGVGFNKRIVGVVLLAWVMFFAIVHVMLTQDKQDEFDEWAWRQVPVPLITVQLDSETQDTTKSENTFDDAAKRFLFSDGRTKSGIVDFDTPPVPQRETSTQSDSSQQQNQQSPPFTKFPPPQKPKLQQRPQSQPEGSTSTQPSEIATQTSPQTTKKTTSEGQDTTPPSSSNDKPNVCVKWRQTGGCNPTGPREPQNDVGCDECVRPTASGFCECINGHRAEPHKCQHNSFTCQIACEAKILGIPSFIPDKCANLKPSTSSQLSIGGLGKPFPDQTSEPPKCEYASAFATWDPWQGNHPARCSPVNHVFQAQGTHTHIIITANCNAGNPRCAIGKFGPHHPVPEQGLRINLDPSPSELLPDGLAEDYAACLCGSAEEVIPLAIRATKAAKRLALRFELPPATSGAKKINVVYIMIDAVSRPHFYRALPRTVKAIQEIQKDGLMDVFEFEFSTILGAFSPPNRWAAFSGHPPFFADCKYAGNPFEEYSGAFANIESSRNADSWLWDYFANRGYVTFSARDMCSKLANFVYGEYITKPWTDTHFQQFFCDRKLKFIESPTPRCIKNSFAHELVMDAARRFREVHSELAQFLFLDFIDGHEPSQRLVRSLDLSMPQFINDMLSDMNTIVLLVSDHGIGDRGRCPSVRLEERLPVSMLFAPSGLLTDQMREALSINQKRLITPIDTFETVARIARFRATGQALDSEENIRPWAFPLWREIPNRLCKEAGVPIKGCVCKQYGLQDVAKPPIKW